MRVNSDLFSYYSFLKQNYEYIPELGKLRILNHRVKRLIGTILKGSIGKNGYIYISIANRKIFQEHRVVFLLCKGYLPKMIDHINGINFINKIENLRETSDSQNQQNRKKYLRNGKMTSKFKGVRKQPDRNKYRAYISINKKQINLGSFKDEKDAARAYDEKAKELFGDFASLNFN